MRSRRAVLSRPRSYLCNAYAHTDAGNTGMPRSSTHQPASINDTWFNRFLVLAAIRTLGRFRPKDDVAIFFATKSLCIKYGPLRHLPEASTMVFIAANTSIPVPRIYCAFTRKGRTYIVMERIRGTSIGSGWASRPPESKAKILRQLKEMIQSMRNLKAPSPAVANTDGGSLWDCRLPGKALTLGPFEDTNAFHRHLRGGLTAASASMPPSIHDLFQAHDREWPAPVLTHGDLSSLNILAQGDRITGIVDWETAGWYPYYWEYTTALQVNFQNEFWAREIDSFLQPYPEELKMEHIRQEYFGDT